MRIAETKQAAATPTKGQIRLGLKSEKESVRPHFEVAKLSLDDSLGEGRGDDESKSSRESRHEEDDGENQTLHSLRSSSVRDFVHGDVDEDLGSSWNLRCWKLLEVEEVE